MTPSSAVISPRPGILKFSAIIFHYKIAANEPNNILRNIPFCSFALF